MRPELEMALELLIFKPLQIQATTILVEGANSKHVLYQPTCGELDFGGN